MVPPAPLSFPPGQEGVLPSQHLTAAIGAGAIDAGPFKIPLENVQPASLDLRLGEVAYRVRASFLPGPGATVGERIDDLKLH